MRWKSRAQSLLLEGVSERVSNNELLSEGVCQELIVKVKNKPPLVLSSVAVPDSATESQLAWQIDRYGEGRRKAQAVTLKEMPFNWIMILSICRKVYQLEQVPRLPFCPSASTFIWLSACRSLYAIRLSTSPVAWPRQQLVWGLTSSRRHLRAHTAHKTNVFIQDYQISARTSGNVTQFTMSFPYWLQLHNYCSLCIDISALLNASPQTFYITSVKTFKVFQLPLKNTNLLIKGCGFMVYSIRIHGSGFLGIRLPYCITSLHMYHIIHVCFLFPS